MKGYTNNIQRYVTKSCGLLSIIYQEWYTTYL